MRRLVGTLTILVAAVAVGLGITVALHHRATAGGAPQTLPAGPATTASVPVDIVPGAGQTFLTGTVTSFSADNAVGPALTPPFTITVPVRGAGSADLTGVSVAGKAVEIFWYGGQPLPVSGTGQLAIDGGAVTVDTSGITWTLDGAVRSLAPGHYRLGAPVAVGSSGLATPYQSIAFDAGAGATMQTTGKARVHLAPAALHITGPGSVTLQGDLQAQTPAGTRRVPRVTFGPGSYSIDLTPMAGGDTVNATLQGPVTLG